MGSKSSPAGQQSQFRAPASPEPHCSPFSQGFTAQCWFVYAEEREAGQARWRELVLVSAPLGQELEMRRKVASGAAGDASVAGRSGSAECRLRSDEHWPRGPEQSPQLFLRGSWMGCAGRALTALGKQRV